jgi:preprotein translocase subunit SecE
LKYFGDVKIMAEKVEGKVISPKKRMKIVQFFIDLKAEFKRVTWPTKDELKKALMAVICFCLLYAITVGLLDAGFKNLFNLIFK